MPTLQLAWRSLRNRRGTALLTLAAIAVSVALLLGVQKLRVAARDSFANTVSGVDLIVGARGGPLNLLLYSIFRVGEPTANVSWETYQRIARHPDVAWTIPLALGDTHRGFRVLGTNADYFAHYQFAGSRKLQLASGHLFETPDQAVLGAQVAEQLGYSVGDEIVLAHGLGDVSFARHEERPFRVTGILASTGTPVDRTVHVSLEAISGLHASDDAEEVEPPGLAAFLVTLRSKSLVLTMQRAINEYRQEPLLAIIPGVVLVQLWNVVGIADTALLVVAAFVVLAGLLGMLTALLTSLGERRREMAVLRSVGAAPRHVFGLLVAEAGLLGLAGTVVGVLVTYVVMMAGRTLLEARFGISLRPGGLSRYDLLILGSVVCCALLIGLLPAWRAYRNTLSDGLTVRT